jgi:GT2 family glycosyltransferase
LVDNNSSDYSIEIIKDWAAGNVSFCARTSKILENYSISSSDKKIACHVHTSLEIEAAIEGRANLGSKLNQEIYPGSEANAMLTLIDANRNGGFGAGNNLALKCIQLKGDGDYIWLLNNDTAVTPNSMAEMVACAQQKNGIAGATLLSYYNPITVEAYGGGYFSQTTGRISTEVNTRPSHLDFINGASFMFSSEIFKSVGYFDENIFLYFEEIDYCFRAKRKGYGCFLSDAIVYHKRGASSSNEDDSFAWRHALKNKPYVLKKNFGLGLWVIIYVFGVLASALGLASSRGKRKASRAVVAVWLSGIFGRFTFTMGGKEKLK